MKHISAILPGVLAKLDPDRFTLKPHEYEPFQIGPDMHQWKPIDTRPKDEDYGPFLVLLPKNDVAPFVIVQVSNFEGRMYPDAMEYMIDWDSAVTTATHWMPPLKVPKLKEIEHENA